MLLNLGFFLKKINQSITIVPSLLSVRFSVADVDANICQMSFDLTVFFGFDLSFRG